MFIFSFFFISFIILLNLSHPNPFWSEAGTCILKSSVVFEGSLCARQHFISFTTAFCILYILVNKFYD